MKLNHVLLRKERERKSWTLQELERRSGVSEKAIRNAETGRSSLRRSNLLAVSTALGREPEYFLIEDETPEGGLPPEGSSGPPDDVGCATNEGPAFPTLADCYHGAALKVDRAAQWLPVIEGCQADAPVFFYMHGERAQSLDLFLMRLDRFLVEAARVPHHIVHIPVQLEFSVPATPAAWENRLSESLLRARVAEHGTAAQLLRESSRSRSLLLLLHVGSLELCTEEGEVGALVDFLASRLPRVLRAASPRHPVRFLLAVNYLPDEHLLSDRLSAALAEGAKAAEVFYRPLPALHPVDWGHVEDYLNGHRPPVADRIRSRIREAFERLQRHSDLTFRQLVELVEQHLQ